MKLKELKNLIFSDLTLVCGIETYYNVDKNGSVFRSLEEKEVIGIRASRGGYLNINIK